MQLNHVVLPAKFCIIFVYAESVSCANWVTDIKRVGGDAELCQTRWQTSNLSATSSLSVCRTVTMTVLNGAFHPPDTNSDTSIINTVLYSLPSAFFSFYSSIVH